MSRTAAVTIGVSLKLYLDVATTLGWCEQVRELARSRPAVQRGHVRLWVAPSLPALPLVAERVRDSGLGVGAQDLFWADRGAYTGAVSGADLRDLGCRYVVIGHAERRRYFGEDENAVARKTAAALRNNLIPVLCVGEAEPGSVTQAARQCLRQLDAALGPESGPGEIVVAYEPHWAIGASEPAGPAHIGAVCTALRDRIAADPKLAGSAVIYGGSAGPGLLTRLGNQVDGLFLGRFAHDPRRLGEVLDEAERMALPA
ncbi:triose-phosphate isomerase [Plantactinospora mayteni]|uniref:Triosephosphate isomerase n=1 Tax=Plantactinospora mayteni TaxID=566021 RepID=A0ABQ4F038_9ACTN|nr:triose-phosphate isomerase family protein [Plantactinospora mayteni]GIH00274.1 triosephosphate isomerase [Plantactinospora mayteni]